MRTQKYKITCGHGHELELTPDELDDVLQTDLSCPNESCGGRIIELEPDQVHFNCVCMHETWASLEEAQWMTGEQCQECADTIGRSHYFIEGSLAGHVAEYNFRRNTDSARKYLIREDYWEYVTHFCRTDVFEKIVESRRIEARPTGYFKEPAVCLTDMPLHCADAIRNKVVFGGACGFVFKKKSLIKLGLAPAMNLYPHQIQRQKLRGGFDETIRPMVNKIDDQFNFLHEREWRVPQTIDFDKIPPFRVVLPKGPAWKKMQATNPSWLISAVVEFGEMEV